MKTLKSDQRPDLPDFAHPVYDGGYIFLTNQAAIMNRKINIWIRNRIPGAIIYGRPRLGKTKAINYNIRVLEEQWGERANFYYVTTTSYAHITENIFFEELLRSIGHPETRKGTIVEKRIRVNRFLIGKASLTGAKKIVFFIDEAQRLTEKQYDLLMDVYNELYANGITLTTILVGQIELKRIRSTFYGYKDMIRERFMTDLYEFHGIEDIADLKLCLRQYDQELTFPEKSGWTFTRYYYPSQFETGFRLENYAKQSYDSFWQIQQEHSLTAFQQVPMQYFTLFVEYILREYGIEGLDCQDLSKDSIRDAILMTGYGQMLSE